MGLNKILMFICKWIELYQVLHSVSPGVMMRDSVDTEADFGTLPPGERCCLSGVSSWLPKHLGLLCSLGDECFVPVLLLRSLIRRRLDAATSAAK